MVCESHFMLWESEPQNLTTDWLDLCIKTGDSLSVGMKLNELKFVDGIAPTMQKTRVPLFVYEDIVDIDYLMALARSKCARWFQVDLMSSIYIKQYCMKSDYGVSVDGRSRSFRDVSVTVSLHGSAVAPAAALPRSNRGHGTG